MPDCASSFICGVDAATQSKAQMKPVVGNSNLERVFAFDEGVVRVIGTQDEKLFVTKDICQALGIEQATRAVENLKENVKGVKPKHTPGGEQNMLDSHFCAAPSARQASAQLRSCAIFLSRFTQRRSLLPADGSCG